MPAEEILENPKASLSPPSSFLQKARPIFQKVLHSSDFNEITISRITDSESACDVKGKVIWVYWSARVPIVYTLSQNPFFRKILSPSFQLRKTLEKLHAAPHSPSKRAE